MSRAFDVVAAAAGLMVLSPFLFLIGLLVRLGDGGPALFVQSRIGRFGRAFNLFKFRSMSMDPGGAGITVGADRRITRVGRLLRATKFDEFPQLFNVLRGDMSLVGPRPEIETYVKLYAPAQLAVLELRPGITDPASFAFYDESALLARQSDPHHFYENVLIGEKIRINLEYARTRTFWTDLVLIVATVAKPLGLHVNVFELFRLTPPDPEILK